MPHSPASANKNHIARPATPATTTRPRTAVLLAACLGAALPGSFAFAQHQADHDHAGHNHAAHAHANADTVAASQPIKMVPFDQVTMQDQLWQPRIEQLVKTTLPHAFANTEVARRRLELCAQFLENGGKQKDGVPLPEAHRFNTSDLYKVLEGGALMLKTEPNPEIEALMDRAIDVIARAQQADGYLYVSHIVGNPIEREMGNRPYAYVLHSHELYNIGHLYEAAVAYAQATGKTKLLEVAEKSAQHVNRVFFIGDPNYNDGKPVMQAPGHQEIELGLVKLHLYTGNPLYLQMAKKFLDIRGVTYVPHGQGVNSESYAQQQKPVAEQREAVGHAVRATYQYAAMAEVDSLMGTTDYSQALDSIWHNIVDTKMHITGGLGAVHGIEGFGPSFELPNKDTYLETCAAVGNVFFNMRMFLKYADAQYIDVAEVALLNNSLAGVGLDGTSFFYPNPLEADPGHGPRSAWFGTACCPSNIARLIPQVPGYIYAQTDSDLYCVLYASNQTTRTLGGQTVGLKQTTNYPYDGQIQLAIDPEQPAAFNLHVRIPTWAQDRLVPGTLYKHINASAPWQIHVNGNPVDAQLDKGFVSIDRTWQAGDVVTIDLPMTVHASHCDPQVEANHNRVAFTRGPLVFCAEGIDNAGTVQRFFVDPEQAIAKASVHTIASGKLAGLPMIGLPAQAKTLEGNQPATAHLVPYFAWSNRDRGSMITWLPTTSDLAQVDLYDPSNLKFESVTASHTFDGDNVNALRMQTNPQSSADTSIPRWTSWPQKGQRQTVDIALGKPTQIKAIGLYFYDDQGGVQVPGQWHLETQNDQGQWQPVAIYNTDNFDTLKDTYNTVHPAQALTTDRIRLVLTPQHNDTTVGLLSIQIDTPGPRK